MTQEERFMKEALRQAKKAYKIEEVPIGCVIVYEGKIIAKKSIPTGAHRSAEEIIADMAKVAVERAGEHIRTNLAEYLEKGIVK